MKNGNEKAIAAALEPLIAAIVALEKEQMALALEKRIERRDARVDPGTGSPGEPADS